MKTKEQILDWLDRQPWKYEFYEATVTQSSLINYSEDFLNCFEWSLTKQDVDTWTERNEEYLKWYNSTNATDKPRSWAEYCIQNPITKDDWCIEYGEVCKVFDPRFYTTEQERDSMTCIDVMSKKYCEAFIAYMKLFQLRNAWVEDENLDDSPVTYRILYQDNMFDVFQGHTSTGLSFLDKEEAKEFMVIFKDLLNIAKPLL